MTYLKSTAQPPEPLILLHAELVEVLTEFILYDNLILL